MESTKTDINSIEHVDARELLTFAEQNSNLKVLRAKTPFKNCFLSDIRIQNKMMEDKVYLDKSEILAKIRRGNCLMEIQNEKTNRSSYQIARKGLIKFFDYQLNPKKNSKEDRIVWEKLTEFYKKLEKESIQNDFNGVFVYSTEKANGENLQISYTKNLDAWIIGSKNVTIVVKNENDLDFYRNFKDENQNKVNEKEFSPAQRFSYCVEFAELWFEIMKRNIEAKNLLDEFKSELDGFTLIGENIGDENHQHIKLYSERDIHFYALIQNDSTRICAPLDKCKAFLNKYNLTMVHYQKSPLIKSKDELKEFMNKLYIETLNKDVEEGGEGSVVYFCKLDNNEEQVVQLAKLKTFEYRFLRKLREKIRSLKSKNIECDTIVHKIKCECESILGEEGDSFDLTELLKFAKFVLMFVFKSGVKLNYEDQYAFYINAMKNLYDISIKEANLPEMTEEEKNIFEASKEKANNEIERVMDRIKNRKININLSLEKLFKQSTVDFEEFKSECFKNKFKIGHIYIIANIGLVGSGKSAVCKIIENELKNRIEEEELNLEYVSSDEIRYLQDYNGSDVGNLKKIKNQFENKFKEFVKNSPKTKYNIIIADKNFFVDTLVNFVKNLETLSKSMKKHLEVICFIPKCSTNFNNCEISINYIMQSYYRLKERKDHETLDFEKCGKEKALQLFLSFLALFHSKKFANVTDLNINYYGLSMSDEKKIENENMMDVLGPFHELIEKIKVYPFKFEQIAQLNEDIEAVFVDLEEIFPKEKFESTIELVVKEIDEFMENKI